MVTPIWRKWADRFYPALTDAELEVIALRTGNEKAFNLVNKTPLEESIYLDQVNGTVNNRYYYRIRLQNTALAESTDWSELSEPVIPPKVMPPGKPVFTKIEAGDREITLHWALNREPDLEKYILYRSESKEDLQDLRWWDIKADPRIIAVIQDPRLKVNNRALKIPGHLPISEPIGVYRADEFNFNANPVDNQFHALNYFNSSPSSQSEPASEFIASTNPEELNHEITYLRRIENASEVVVVYRNEVNEKRFQSMINVIPPYKDKNLIPLKKYYYRLSGINSNGFLSISDEIKNATAIDQSIPEPPDWINIEWVRVTGNSGELLPATSDHGIPAVRIEWETPEKVVQGIKVERMGTLGNWLDASTWLSSETTEFLDLNFEDTAENIYRLKVKSFAGNINSIFNELSIKQDIG